AREVADEGVELGGVQGRAEGEVVGCGPGQRGRRRADDETVDGDGAADDLDHDGVAAGGQQRAGEDRRDGRGAGEVDLSRGPAVDEDLGGAAGRHQGGVEGDERAVERDRGGVAAGAVAGDRAAVVVRQARRRLHPVRGRGGVHDLWDAAGVVGVVVVDDRQRVAADGERERRGGGQA